MFQKQVFFSRLLSTVVLWSLVLGTIFTGFEPGFVLVICGLGLIGLWEFYEGVRSKGWPVFSWVGMGCGAALMVGGFAWFSGFRGWGRGDFSGRAYDFETAVLVLSVLTIFGRQIIQRTTDPLALEGMAFTLFGLLYVAWLFSFCTKLFYLLPRNAGGHVTGNWFILYLCVVSKFSDMGAYVTGSLIGKHLLIPRISPKKTWEGFFGALAFSVGGSFLLWTLLPRKFAIFNMTDIVVLGLGLGFAAILGDLAESMIKRSLNLKDSGRLLPGIGGSLDLIDSVLFTAPLLFFYLRLAKHLP